MALASMMKWDLHQMDVKTAFLNGVIEEEVYIEQPQGFEVEDKRTHVCKLKKSLYSLKQDPRAWYGRIDSFLTGLGFTKVRLILTFTSRLWMMNLSYYCCMWMTYSLKVMRSKSHNVRRSLL